MSGHHPSQPRTSDPLPYLDPLSALAAKSFPSTPALIEAILALMTEQLGLRTSFLTQITPAENRNHVLAVYNQPHGCDLVAGIDLPLEDTFWSAITGSVEPTPLRINNTRTDPTFRWHRASTAAPGIGSFLGVPIVLSTGEIFGTLCAIDPEAQELSTNQADLLTVLGRIIATHLERDRELVIRTQAEAEQARLYQAAQEAIREREALLSIASHELKTPLTAVLGYADLLQRHLRDIPQVPERDQRAVQSLVAQAHRLNRLLTDILDVSRVDRGHFSIDRRPMDVALLVHMVVEEVQPMLTAHPVMIEDEGRPILVAGDEERLAQVLRNLLSNAVKYSPGGGRIRVVVTSDGAQACLAIHDEGIGIPAEALPHLFQRFYRAPATSQTIQGLGIGLYVVKEIVTQHDGTIRVASTEGEGTTFTICLPMVATPC